MKAAINPVIRPVRLSVSEVLNEMRRQEDIRANTLAAPELRLARIELRDHVKSMNFMGVAM